MFAVTIFEKRLKSSAVIKNAFIAGLSSNLVNFRFSASLLLCRKDLGTLSLARSMLTTSYSRSVSSVFIVLTDMRSPLMNNSSLSFFVGIKSTHVTS